MANIDPFGNAWNPDKIADTMARMQAERDHLDRAMAILTRAQTDPTNARKLVADAFQEYMGKGPTDSWQLLEDERVAVSDSQPGDDGSRTYGVIGQPNDGDGWILLGTYDTPEEADTGKTYALAECGFFRARSVIGTVAEFEEECANLSASADPDGDPVAWAILARAKSGRWYHSESRTTAQEAGEVLAALIAQGTPADVLKCTAREAAREAARRNRG